MTPEPPALRALDLAVTFGVHRAVDGVDLTVAAREVVALIGPNGAGKSTLLDAVSGVVRSRGRVEVAGSDVTRARPSRRHRAGLARTHQTPVLVGPTPLLEVAVAAGGHRGALRGALTVPTAAHRRRAAELLDAVGFPATGRHRPVEDLGLVDQRRVEFARALASQPRLLLVDEPAAGLSPAERTSLVGLLRSLPALGTAVVLVEHDMQLVASIAPRVVALDAGRVVVEGSFAEVAAHPAVRQAYLGDAIAVEAATGASRC